MNEGICIGALTHLAHNGDLISKAERILQETVLNQNAWVWIELPDGSTIRLKPGFKIKSVEIARYGRK